MKKRKMRWITNIRDVIETRRQFIQIFLIKVFIAGIFLHFKISNLTLILLTIFWFLSGDYKNSLSALSKKKILILFLGFYALHIAGLLYSDNLYSAYKELEKKIPMLLLPVIIASVKDENWRFFKKDLFAFYVKVTGLVCVILIIYSLYRFLVTADPEVFYFIEFTRLLNLNPIYMAMYLLFAFGLYFYELSTSTGAREWIKKIAVYFFVLLVLMLLSSKTALAVFVVITIHFVLKQLTRASAAIKIAAAVLPILILVAILNYFPITRERIRDVFQSDWSGIWQDDYTRKATTFTGFTLRVSFWKITLIQLAKDKLLLQGVGTGDTIDYLNKAYKPYGLIDAGFTSFNLHNAFLEVILEFGIIGFIYYSILWGAIVVCAIQNKNQVLMILIVIFIFFSMTESILYVNKGLAFFSFWVSILLNFIYMERNNNLAVAQENQ